MLCYVCMYVCNVCMYVCIVLYCIVLYCIVLYCIVLYCIVLYCIVLYCIVCLYVCMYVCMYTCIYIYVYIYVCIHISYIIDVYLMILSMDLNFIKFSLTKNKSWIFQRSSHFQWCLPGMPSPTEESEVRCLDVRVSWNAAIDRPRLEILPLMDSYWMLLMDTIWIAEKWETYSVTR